MRTVEQYLCDQCDKVIARPEDGFVIHGNIYVADPSCIGGLIGNNFPPLEEGEKLVSIDKIKQTVMCKTCFFRGIGVTDINTPRAVIEVGLDSKLTDRKSESRGPSPYDAACRRSSPKIRNPGVASPYDAGAPADRMWG